MTNTPSDLKLSAGRNTQPVKGEVAAVGASPWYDPWNLGDPLGVGKFWDSYFKNFARMGSFRWDKDHLGGVTYDFAKDLAQQMASLTPPPYRTQLDEFLKSEAGQTTLRGKNMSDMFEMIGQQLELIKKTRRMWGMPVQDAELFGNAYNHQFLVEDKNGKIVAVSEQQLLGLFPQTDPVTGEVPKQFPHVVFTASHARGETLKDVTEITHGVEANIRRATKGAAKFATVDTSRNDLGVAPDETLILYRCDVRENPWLNGAALLRRNHELEHCEETGETDQFKESSPGSWAINHLMLAWMAQQPQQVLDAGNKPLAEFYANNPHPIELRTDAGRVAQHFMLHGYSKGGTVVSDAGPRMLPHELQAKDANGRDLFFCEQEGEMRPITRDGIYEVRKIIRQIPTWACAAVEHGLTDEQIAAGANRDAFNSEDDEISRHDNYPGRRHDERHIIKGVKADNGHAPVAALGSRDTDGYAMDDPRVARRMEELCAPMIGKAALEGMRFDTGNASEVRLEVVAGTSDRLVEHHRETIISALAEAGLAGAVLRNPHPFSGEFTLTFDHAVTNNAKEMIKLKHAFHSLREGAPGLVICERLLAEDIDPQLTKMESPDVINNAGTTVAGSKAAGRIDSGHEVDSGVGRGGKPDAPRPNKGWGTGPDAKPGPLHDLIG